MFEPDTLAISKPKITSAEEEMHTLSHFYTLVTDYKLTISAVVTLKDINRYTKNISSYIRKSLDY